MGTMTSALWVFTVLLYLCTTPQGALSQCSLSDIVIFQKLIENDKWILVYEVQVSNKCKCPQANLTLQCPGFNSTMSIDPAVFRKNGDNCLINNGQPVTEGHPIIFKYGWKSPFVMRVASSEIQCP